VQVRVFALEHAPRGGQHGRRRLDLGIAQCKVEDLVGAALSAASQPAPIPRTNRPPLKASSEEIIFAVTTALRYGTMSTVVPSRTRLVAPAMTASVTRGSKTVSPKFLTLACGTTT